MVARLIFAFTEECQGTEDTVIEIRRSALVRHSPEQMFDLVDSVEAYPMRFPWCAGSNVIERDGNVLVARLDLRFAGLKHSFTTRNTAARPHRIDIRLVNGPFRTLDGTWSFTALGDDGCKVALALDFDYAGIGGSVLKLGFQGLANRMVDDFCRAADSAHG